MDKRKLIILTASAVIVVALIVVVFDTNLINRAQQTGLDSTNTLTTGTDTADSRKQTGNTEAGNSRQTEQTIIAPAASIEIGEEALINSEKVDVSYNTPEYELSLELCENSNQKTFIRMQYYLNGSAVDNKLDEGNIPELAGIFEGRAKESGSTEAYRIKQALLNPVHSQLYLLIQGAPFEVYSQSSFYVINLNDTSIKKLFSYPCLYGKMAFNKDFSLLAYSFGDPPVMSMQQEDNLLEVLDCSITDYIIKGNVAADFKKLGSNSSPDLLYDYEFEAWQSIGILKLKQAVRPLNDLNSGLTQTEVLYDIKKNLLLNPDGSEQKLSVKDTQTKADKPADVQASATSSATPFAASSGTSSETGSAIAEDPVAKAEPTDSEPVKVLKSFYSYLGSENNYARAMQLLDDSFRLRLQMIRQFGAEELVKSDIDEESASTFSNILKSAKFETLSGETTKVDKSSVKYVQIFGAGTDAQVKQEMTAELKKIGKAWKIILIEDGLK
jgi:hypothetical protein